MELGVRSQESEVRRTEKFSPPPRPSPARGEGEDFQQMALPLGPDLPNKTFLRPDELSSFFRVSKSTIYRWADEGLLRGCSLTEGTLRIFRESALELMKKTLR